MTPKQPAKKPPRANLMKKQPLTASQIGKAMAALRKPKNMVRGDSEYYRNLRLKRVKKD